MKKMLLVIPALLAGCLLAQTGMAEASLYRGWSATPTISDNNDEFKQATDILAAWHTRAGDYHYFRIDIETPPSAAEWTEIYGIYINSQAGVGANGSGMSLESKVAAGGDIKVAGDIKAADGDIKAAGDIKVAGDAFTWYAASHGITLDSDTHDLTAAAQASAVPLPAGFWPLGSGLFGLAGVRRKRTR